uniref:Uncharacterized protein n=1 Tax=Nothobranchius furzeri TaxID=105023 RepID=A0A8C6NHI2_NOTFU
MSLSRASVWLGNCSGILSLCVCVFFFGYFLCNCWTKKVGEGLKGEGHNSYRAVLDYSKIIFPTPPTDSHKRSPFFLPPPNLNQMQTPARACTRTHAHTHTHTRNRERAAG